MDAAVTPYRQVRADYDDDSLIVYQAYVPQIADAAVKAQRFVPPFSLGRMTWIKPSFLWMMYRSGWAKKPGQERVLSIRISRTGFETALSRAVLSSFDPDVYSSHNQWRTALTDSTVRIQWDPERDPDGHPLAWRSLQMGLSGTAAQEYVDDWVRGIEDITQTLPARRNGTEPLPVERPYPLSGVIVRRIGATPMSS